MPGGRKISAIFLILSGALASGDATELLGQIRELDEDALAAALHEGRLGGAGLDTFVTEPLPANVALFVGDLGGGTGPVEFVDGSGTAASGLSFVFGGLGDPTDSLEFSTDGISYAYTPVPDADGFDAAVRFVRVRPFGSFQAADNGLEREFRLRFRVRVQ